MYTLRISSDTNSINIYTFYLSEASVDFKEGEYIDIDPLYIPDILIKYPWFLSDFIGGKIMVRLLKDHENPEILSYGTNSVLGIFNEDCLLGRFSISEVSKALQSFKGSNKRWQIKEPSLDCDDIYCCYSVLKLVGKFQVDDDILIRGHKFKKLSSTEEEEN